MKSNDTKEKGEDNLNFAALPHDLVILILLRLPVRSLLRFKSVCKSWLSTISDPQFGNSHFDLAATPTHRLLLGRINHGSEIQSLDFEASLSAVVKLKHPPFRARYFLTLGSCRGFILLMKRKGPSLGDLIVWNPSTGAHRRIPVTYYNWYSWYDPSTSVRQGIPRYFGSMHFGFLYGFGYDHSNDDYLFILIRLCGYGSQIIDHDYGRFIAMEFGGPDLTEFSRPRIEGVSVKTNVPSFIYAEETEYVELGQESKSGLFMNQSLHWLVISKTTGLHVVIAFDLVERSLSEIHLSRDLAERLSIYFDCHLRVLGGCLGLCYSAVRNGHKMTEIWVMEEYKVQSSWTKSSVMSDCLPICLTEGGGVFGSDGSGRFKKFDDKGELLEDHTYRREDKGALKYFDMYRESLLTLPTELS